MPSTLFQFLKPNKRKIIYSLITSILWNISILIVPSLLEFFSPSVPPTKIILLGTPFSIFLGILLESILYYPFACSLTTIYDFYKKEGISKLFEKKYLLSLVLVCLIVFNPIGYLYILSLLTYITPSNTWSCGAYVVEIIPGSPAESSVKMGEAIIKINDRMIHNASDFIDVMNTTKAGEQIDVYLLGGSSFTVNLAQSPTNQTKGFLGVRVRDAVVTAAKNPCKSE